MENNTKTKWENELFNFNFVFQVDENGKFNINEVYDEFQNTLYELECEIIENTTFKEKEQIEIYLNRIDNRMNDFRDLIFEIIDNEFSLANNCSIINEKNEVWDFEKTMKEHEYFIDFFWQIEYSCKNTAQGFMRRLESWGTSLVDRLNKEHNTISYQSKLKSETDNTPLTINQLALISVYNGVTITRENAKSKLKGTGYISGEALFQKFTRYSSTANRKGKTNPFTIKKMENKINLFESIINHVQEPNKQRVKDEIKILKSLLETGFE